MYHVYRYIGLELTPKLTQRRAFTDKRVLYKQKLAAHRKECNDCSNIAMCLAVISARHPAYSFVLLSNRDVGSTFTSASKTLQTNHHKGIPRQAHSRSTMVGLTTRPRPRRTRPGASGARDMARHHEARATVTAHQLPRGESSTGAAQPWRDRKVVSGSAFRLYGDAEAVRKAAGGEGGRAGGWGL